VAKSKKANDEMIETAKRRFKLVKESESEGRKDAVEDLEFRAGKQWPDDLLNERKKDGRPCHVINRLPQHVRQVTNDQRQNRPSIKVSPVDNSGDVETAKIFQGLIRHIQYNSNSEVALDTAFESSVIMGFGFFRIVTDYVSPTSFEQEILIKRIKNPFSVYLDPNYKEPDGSDAEWAFIFQDIPKDEFIEEYGESAVAKSMEWDSLTSQAPEWITNESVRVAEYFCKEYTDDMLLQLGNGETILETELDDYAARFKAQFPNEELVIKNKRKTRVPKVKWYKINGVEILEDTDFPGCYIPVIPVLGDELDINGKRVTEGIIRHAKDSQRMYNFWASNETETISLAPRTPWIVARGQVPKEFQAAWKSANRKNHAYLEYDAEGAPNAPPPQRQVYEPAVAAITQARMQSSEDIKSTTGIYDAALGNRSNENSGVAILRRQNQSQTGNFHFIDNLTRSIKHLGRILVDIIPHIYDTTRAVRIIGDEDKDEVVFINKIFERNGKPAHYDLSAGKYDVTVETGPSFATKRQEAAASMMDFSKVIPAQAAMISDLIAKNMDWPGASEISERLKKLLPPGIADDQKKQPLPPEAEAKMQQMDQMIQQLTQTANEQAEIIKNKHIENQTKFAEIESREKIEAAKIEADIIKKQMDIQGQSSNLIVKAELEDLKMQLQLLRAPNNFQENDLDDSGSLEALNQNNNQSVPGAYEPEAPQME